MAIEVNEGDIVDFNLVTNTILGGKRTGVTVLAPPMAYSVASTIDPELSSKHKNLYPYFKDKVDNVDDPAKYKYFVVQNSNGVKEVIGVPWVLDESYAAIKVRQVTYVIHNFQESMRGTINTMLNNLGANYTSMDSSK